MLSPAACLAAAAAEQAIRLDVVGGGVLAAVCGALVTFLTTRAKAGQQPQRQPPLGEDVTRTYATKAELAQCQGVCRKDIDALREKIDDNDRKAEDRARGTHARIDKVYLS